MSRNELDGLLAEIRGMRDEALAELHDMPEADWELSTTSFRRWRWDTVRRVVLQFGNHMREHATHIQGTRAALDRLPSQQQRMLAEAELAWGALLAALVGLTDEDLDTRPADDGWTVRRILEHVRNSEADYLEAIRVAQAQQEKHDKKR